MLWLYKCICFLKIWPAEIKLNVILLYENSLYWKIKNEEATTSCNVTVIDYQSFLLHIQMSSSKMHKWVRKVTFLSKKRQVCDIYYIYTCLNEQQQRFGYTECESNPWVTPMQFMKMIKKLFNKLQKEKRKKKKINVFFIRAWVWMTTMAAHSWNIILICGVNLMTWTWQKYTINHRGRHILGIRKLKVFLFLVL